MKNCLGLLTDDLLNVNIKNISKLFPDLNLILKGHIKLSELTSIKKNILDLVMVSDLALILFKGDKDKVIEWMKKSEDGFFLSSPSEICIRGDGTKMIDWLEARTC